MIGAAAEGVALELRDLLNAKLKSAGENVPKDLGDWRISKVLVALEGFFARNARDMPPALQEAVRAYWPSYFQFIRTARNDAGHPTNVDPITPEVAHAALLMFPELGKLAQELSSWVATRYSKKLPDADNELS